MTWRSYSRSTLRHAGVKHFPLCPLFFFTGRPAYAQGRPRERRRALSYGRPANARARRPPGLCASSRVFYDKIFFERTARHQCKDPHQRWGVMKPRAAAGHCISPPGLSCESNYPRAGAAFASPRAYESYSYYQNKYYELWSCNLSSGHVLNTSSALA